MTTQTEIPALDHMVQKTHEWLKDLVEELNCGTDQQHAFQILRAVLHALRDRLPAEEAAQLAAQLPLVIRGLFYEGWRPSKTPLLERTREQFLWHVAGSLPENAGEPEPATRAVFRLLARHVSRGEIEDVKATLPAALRSFFI